jgi:hypothetical protein
MRIRRIGEGGVKDNGVERECNNEVEEKASF